MREGKNILHMCIWSQILVPAHLHHSRQLRYLHFPLHWHDRSCPFPPFLRVPMFELMSLQTVTGLELLQTLSTVETLDVQVVSFHMQFQLVGGGQLLPTPSVLTGLHPINILWPIMTAVSPISHDSWDHYP